MRYVTHAQGQLNISVVVTELPETHRQIEHEDVPGPGQQRIELIKSKKNQARHQCQADNREQPRKRSVLVVAGIEMPFKKIRQPGQRPAHEQLIGQGPSLLKKQDDDQGKQTHPERNLYGAGDCTPLYRWKELKIPQPTGLGYKAAVAVCPPNA